MAGTETPTQTEESSIDQILSELLTSNMAEALSKAQALIVTFEASALPIGIKLDGSNYGLWSQFLEIYIFGKDKLGYINGELTLPSPIDPSFHKWHTDNAIVKRMAYQLHGSNVNWKLYSISHSQTGVGLCCHHLF